jgi:hypothetical protein
MWTVDAAIEELLEKLREVREIDAGVGGIEQQYGPDLDDRRRRYRRVCNEILAQLGALVCGDWSIERVH